MVHSDKMADMIYEVGLGTSAGHSNPIGHTCVVLAAYINRLKAEENRGIVLIPSVVTLGVALFTIASRCK